MYHTQFINDDEDFHNNIQRIPPGDSSGSNLWDSYMSSGISVSDNGPMILSDLNDSSLIGVDNPYQLYDNVVFQDGNSETNAKIINIDKNVYDVLILKKPYGIKKLKNAVLSGSKFLDIFKQDAKVIVLDLNENLYTNMQNIRPGTISCSVSSTEGAFHDVIFGTDSCVRCDEKQLLPNDGDLIKNLRNYVNVESTTEKIFEMMYKVSIVKMFFSFRFDHKQNGIPTINENTTFNIYKCSNDNRELLQKYFTEPHFTSSDIRIYKMNKNCKKLLKNIKNYFSSHINTIFSINHMYEIIVGNVDAVIRNNDDRQCDGADNDQLSIGLLSLKSNSNGSQESYYLIVLNSL
jgi:hypothetical protein